MKYVRKVIEIEAVQFTRKNWCEVEKFTKGKVSGLTRATKAHSCCDIENTRYFCWLDTDYGKFKVHEGSYICKDEYGELCVYHQYVFETNFVPAEKEESKDESSEEVEENETEINE